MAANYYHDPAFRKLLEVKAEAISLGLPESIITGLQSVEDLHMARDAYCESKTSNPSDAVATLMKDTLEHPWKQVFKDGKTKVDITPSMMSGNLEGYVLKFLISASKAKRVLEVGMFTGCGALGMAEVLPEDGKVTTCEIDPYVADLARTFLDKSPHGKKVEILHGLAMDSLTELAKKGEKYDFVFIDADKVDYCDYFNICFNDLLAPGGTIAMDNALLGGKPYLSDTPPNDGVTKFNDMIVTRDDIYYVLMAIRDGVMLIRRKEDMNGS